MAPLSNILLPTRAFVADSHSTTHTSAVENMVAVLGLFLLTVLFAWIPGLAPAVALKASLLAGYDKSSRPVKAASTPVNVDFDITLKQIIDLAEKEQAFRMNLWLRLYWVDEYLTWNASEHGGVDSLTIHSSDIWRPDIFLSQQVSRNIAETYGVLGTVTDLSVTSTGQVSYLTPAIFTSACPVDITRFPFDRQNCVLEFGSWIYTGSQLNISLIKSSADTSTYTKSEEWILRGAPMERKVAVYTCCPDPYVSVLFTLQLSVGPSSIYSTWFSLYHPDDTERVRVLHPPGQRRAAGILHDHPAGSRRLPAGFVRLFTGNVNNDSTTRSVSRAATIGLVGFSRAWPPSW
ncbi:hypothetical protein Bbelb_273360 [Branchiostoma belcheri]|nr:hypothetical protein Bbelb_273360 [Branchiostoma belcheri]